MTYRRAVVLELLLFIFLLGTIVIDTPVDPQQPIERPPRMFLVSGDTAVEGIVSEFCRRTGEDWSCVDKPVKPQSFPTQAALTTLTVEEGAPVMILFGDAQPLTGIPGLTGGSTGDAPLWEPAASTRIRYRIGDGPWKELADPSSFPTPGSGRTPTTVSSTIEFDVRWEGLNASYVFQMESAGQDQRSIGIPLTGIEVR